MLTIKKISLIGGIFFGSLLGGLEKEAELNKSELIEDMVYLKRLEEYSRLLIKKMEKKSRSHLKKELSYCINDTNICKVDECALMFAVMVKLQDFLTMPDALVHSRL